MHKAEDFVVVGCMFVVLAILCCNKFWSSKNRVFGCGYCSLWWCEFSPERGLVTVSISVWPSPTKPTLAWRGLPSANGIQQWVSKTQGVWWIGTGVV